MVAIVAVINSIALSNYFFDTKYQRENVRAASQYLENHYKQNDQIIASAAYTGKNLKFYYNGDYELKVMGYPSNEINSNNSDSKTVGAEFVDLDHIESDLKYILENQNRFWLFLSRTFHSDPNGLIRSFCETNFKRELHASWNGTELILFSTEKKNMSSLNTEKSSERP